MTATPPSEYDAVLLAGFGGPEGPDDVMPFLRNVTRGRGVPDERLAEVAEHYLALGGMSPINAHNRALRSALAAELGRRGVTLPVLWGNRNWAPYLGDVVADAHGAGQRRLLAVATSAYSSYSSCRQYREDFAAALISTGLVGEVAIDKVRPYYDLPGFLQPFADGVRDALRQAHVAGYGPSDLEVVFTTHSIPIAMADSSGAPLAATSDRGGFAGFAGAAGDRLYVAQHLAACAEVMRRADGAADDAAGSPAWRLAYQSRSGAAHIPWLEPDIGDVLAEMAAAGRRGVVVVPIGFVSDHVEVIWDLDTEAAQIAAAHGLWFRRVATPGADPRFVAGLVDLIMARLGGGDPVPSSTALPARPDVCPPGCCRGRVAKPTTAGADSAADWGEVDIDPALLAASGIGAALPW